MNFEIFKPVIEEKDVVRLALRLDEDEVAVFVVDEKGEREHGGTLLSFQPDGTIYLNGMVNSCFGFQLDGKGKIKISE